MRNSKICRFQQKNQPKKHKIENFEIFPLTTNKSSAKIDEMCVGVPSPSDSYRKSRKKVNTSAIRRKNWVMR